MPAQRTPGRPREFDLDSALEAALQTFWKRGYESTSLDDLTEAMGISRSSFYAAFGSKHDVLIKSLTRYSDRGFATLSAIAVTASTPQRAVRAIVEAIAGYTTSDAGCFLVNTITELAPQDPQVTAIGEAQVDRLERLIATSLAACDPTGRTSTKDTAGKSRALLSLAFGATLLRKASLPKERISAMLTAAFDLIPAEA